MASTKHISRGKNHNVVAAAAYRAGEKLTDTNIHNPDAKTYDYTGKMGVLGKGILIPKELADQGFAIDRQSLWSAVEQHETTTRSVNGSRLKQTARLAREWILALPHELSNEENEQLTAEFTQRLVDDLGVIGDYCIHTPTVKNYKSKIDYIETYDPDTNKMERTTVSTLQSSEPDQRNVHAHIMFTTRKASLTADGELKLGNKADSEISEKHRQDRGLVNGGDYLKEIRSMWADMVNERLAQHDIALVSAKSYKDQGLDLKPQIKEGKNATVLARYGIKTRLSIINDEIREHNQLMLARPSNEILARVIQTHEEVKYYQENILKSDWSADGNGGGSYPNPEPSPRPAYDKRQLDIIDDIELTAREMRQMLIKPENQHIVAMLLDPISEREEWRKKQAMAVAQAAQERAQPTPEPIANAVDEITDRVLNPYDEPRNTPSPSL